MVRGIGYTLHPLKEQENAEVILYTPLLSICHFLLPLIYYPYLQAIYH